VKGKTLSRGKSHLRVFFSLCNVNVAVGGGMGEL